MLIDAHELPNGTVLESDVCIIGAGAAGISMAMEFGGSPLDVCILEAGGLEYDAAVQSLYGGENVGLDYYDPAVFRSRYFGGTTNVWGGWCLPLDEIDFMTRPGLEWSGWPFSKSDLDPYYERANSLCRVGPYDYDVVPWEAEVGPHIPLSPDSFVPNIMRRNPIRFGTEFRQDVDQFDNVKVYLHANATEIVQDAESGVATEVLAKTLSGVSLRVRSRCIVLATGGAENARLLLDSGGSAGIGNDHDLVGRFFMEHPMIPAANFLPADPALNLEIYRDPQLNGVYGRGYLRISPRIMREQELLNARIQIMPGVADELAMKNSDGVLSAAMLWKSIREGKAPNDLATHIGNVISDLDQIAIYSFRRAYRGDADPVSLLYQLEQAPDRNSRIMLSESRDELGSHRVKIDWQVGDHERRTLERVNMILAEEVGKSGLGRVNILADDGETGWPPGLRGSWHQIGTTIMNDDAKSGVVNRDCRVHGTPNLFVAGSSVFSTSGTANPTLTIIALAMRLSDHLKEVLR